MAEKISDSIRRKLKGLQKMLDGAPKEAAASKERARGSRPPANAADPVARGDSAGTPEDKKKLKPQPWYRHRQRW